MAQLAGHRVGSKEDHESALTIKSRIPRETATDRAAGAGAGARDRDVAEDKDRQR